MNDEKIIRKLYGEKMWQDCRDACPTIRETPGLLSKILIEKFNPSRFLYNDIIANNLKEGFLNYIKSFAPVDTNNQYVDKSVEELLSEAGYDFYECKTEEDIQSFRKYYAAGETLCTFKGGRLYSNYVFFAVKKNVSEIRRENFPNPQRQDEYGTSVISIQFTRGKCNTLSIKNRYNHRVNNPDATFSNNLENINKGLTKAFEKEYGFNIHQNDSNSFEIPGYVHANDGRRYKYNYEINNIYYCPDNIIIDNFEVKRDFQEKEKYLVLDYFILDLVNKKIMAYDQNLTDAFIDCNENISKIEMFNEENGKRIELYFEDGTTAQISVDKENRITSYTNHNVTTIGNAFLSYNNAITTIELPKVTTIGSMFLVKNNTITTLKLLNVTTIGDSFLFHNKTITKLELQKVTTIGNYFLFSNDILKTLKFPNVEIIGDDFLYVNNALTTIELPRVETIGDDFLWFNHTLETLELPNLVSKGNGFLCCNDKINNGRKK